MGEHPRDRILPTELESAGQAFSPLIAEYFSAVMPRRGEPLRQEAPRRPDVARTEEADALMLTAHDYRRQADTALDASIRGLRFTTRGTPLAFPFREQFTVPADLTAVGLARRVLGPNASRQQLEFFAQQILDANGRGDEDITTARFERNDVIRMPGQRVDGGVVTRDDERDSTVTRWYNGSSRTENDDGSGFVICEGRDGARTTVNWSPQSRNGNSRIVGNDRTETETRADGTEVRRRVHGRTEDGDPRWVVTSVTRDGRRFDFTYAAGSADPTRVVVTQPNGSWQTYVRNADGEYLTADGRAGARINGEHVDVYSRTQAGNIITRTYESGEIERMDSDGNRLYHRFTDPRGRVIEEHYKRGESTPFQIDLTTADGRTRHRLSRTPAGRYACPMRDERGREIGTIEYENNGDLTFNNHDTNTTRTERSDGAIVTTVNTPHMRAQETVEHNGETLRTTRDRQGNIRTQEYRDGNGRTITRRFEANGTTIGSMTIVDRDGSRTELTWDRDREALTGERKDRDGRLIENVTLSDGRLIYTNPRTGARRVEDFNWPNDGTMPVTQTGIYDANAGTFTRTDRRTRNRIVDYVGGGRTDIIRPDGTIEGTAINGDRSFVRPDGTAQVDHADHTGVRLNRDGTIDRWGPRPEDNVRGERLTRLEAEYLRNHPEIDRRDFAEIHRRLRGNPAAIDRFYRSLLAVDTARNLSAEERSTLRRNLMAHVARPAEIFQGTSWCCNVGVLQRDMAMMQPDRYVAMVVRAVSDGNVRTASGNTVRVDPANLTLRDTTGRDLASRIFQTAALATEFHPGTFRNTEDGVGEVRDRAGRRIPFDGLSSFRIAHLRYELTGEQHAMVHISNANELANLFTSNGRRPIVLSVNGARPPFSDGNGGAAHSGHVVTLVGVESGPPMRFLVQNQWGLGADHSTPPRAISADDLMANMLTHQIEGRRGRTGIVITSHPRTRLDHTRVYEIVDGEIVEVEAETRLERQHRERQRT